MILVTFATTHESGDFRRVLKASSGRIGGEEIRVIHLGMGAPAAAASMARVFAGEKPQALICTGFAGGLAPHLHTGDLVIAENFSAPEWLARARARFENCPRSLFGALVTATAPVETVDAKAALATATGALAVDMETETVAIACAAAGVPLLAVRAISDPAQAALPVPFEEWFDLARQRPRRWRLLRYLLNHPRAVPAFADFLRGLPPARRALADFLVRILAAPE